MDVTAREQAILERRIRPQNHRQWLVTRAKIRLRAAAGQTHRRMAKELGSTGNTVSHWRERWPASMEQGEAIAGEAKDDQAWREWLEGLLRDYARSGSPGKFSAEQLAPILAIAGASPPDPGYPVSHWTPKAIVMEAVKGGGVAWISQRPVGRFLKRSGLESAPNPRLAQPDGKRPRGVGSAG